MGGMHCSVSRVRGIAGGIHQLCVFAWMVVSMEFWCFSVEWFRNSTSHSNTCCLRCSPFTDRNLKVFVARFGWVPRTKDDIAAMAKLDGQGVDGMNS